MEICRLTSLDTSTRQFHSCFTPQKFNIDTKNGQIYKDIHVPKQSWPSTSTDIFCMMVKEDIMGTYNNNRFYSICPPLDPCKCNPSFLMSGENRIFVVLRCDLVTIEMVVKF